MCTSFPCFALLEWPGYATQVVETTIEGQAVVIQLWKGTCQKFLGSSDFPGGVGAEVGVYHQMPGRARPTIDQLVNSGVPKVLAAFIIAGIAPLTDDQLWWAFPELETQIEFTLTNPVVNQTFFNAGPETTYWLNKWMENYGSYQGANHTPASATDYILNYTINGTAFPSW
ncbi:MAG: hypothetical protein WA869_02800 [Alloacidobacterium sp.]